MHRLITSKFKNRLEPFTEVKPNPFIGNLSRFCKKKYSIREKGEPIRIIQGAKPEGRLFNQRPIRCIT